MILRRIYWTYCIVAGTALMILGALVAYGLIWGQSAHASANVHDVPPAPEYWMLAAVDPAPSPEAGVTETPTAADAGLLDVKVLVNGVEPKDGETVVCIVGDPPRITVKEFGSVHKTFWRTRPKLRELQSPDPREFYVTTIAEIDAVLEVFVVDVDKSKDVKSATVNLHFQKTTPSGAPPALAAKRPVPPEEDPEGVLIREIKAVNSATRQEDQKKQAAGIGLAMGTIAAGTNTPDMLAECRSQARAMLGPNASAWDGFWGKVQYLFTFWSDQGVTSDLQGRVIAQKFLEKMGRVRQLLETTK